MHLIVSKLERYRDRLLLLLLPACLLHLRQLHALVTGTSAT
jgi:hypothetical protein